MCNIQIDLTFHFNNILRKLLLQYKIKENVYKHYFVARIVLK
jgi:hypothetical protein